MKVKILTEQEVDVKFLKCDVNASHLENGIINGKEDDTVNPKMPFLVQEGKEWKWKPIIDVDEGKIVEWPVGITAEIYYKSYDENIVYLLDENKNIITWFDENEGEEVNCYEGYVPDILDCIGEGYGDYIQMIIDENGYIKNFNKEEINRFFEFEE
jgi:hypothetical protein